MTYARMLKCAWVGLVVMVNVAGAEPKAKPTLVLGEPTVEGNLEPAGVEAAVKRTEAKLFACYQKELVRDPELFGPVTATFTVTTAGRVTDTVTTGLSRTLEACITRTIAGIKLARSKDGTASTVSVPLIFVSAREAASVGADRADAAPPPSASEPGATSGGFGYARSTADAGGASAGGASAAGAVNAGAGLDMAIIRGRIRRNLESIRACFVKQLSTDPHLGGTVATDFTIGPAGLVTKVKASGVHAAVSQCIAAVIKRIEFPRTKGGGSVNVSYPFQFGSDLGQRDATPAAKPANK